MFGISFNKFIPCGRIKRPYLGRSDLSECRANAMFLFDDVYKNGTRGEKKQADVLQYGRSMVEMLGVLAIIGVLSVGGLAGYNKAMFKHRLNVHAHGFNMILTDALQLKDRLDRKETGETYYAKIFNQLNLIPDGFSYDGGINILDNMGNQLWIYHNSDQNFGGMGYSFAAKSKDGAALCRNILSVAKEHSSDLWMIETYKRHTDEDTTVHGHIYGDIYCKKSNQKCISSLGFAEQEALCDICDDQHCTIYVLWK